MDVKELARVAAGRHGIDPELVAAVIATESSWDAWSVRYEDGFYHRYIDSMTGLTATEKRLRATSFGLMQVMGQTAREFGFSEKWLTQLCSPEMGIEYGCRKLAACLKLENGDVRAGLLRYNGGGDPGYPDRVLKNKQEANDGGKRTDE